LNVYKACIAPKFRPGELGFSAISVTFGTPSPPDFQHNFTLGVLIHFMSRTPLYCGIIDLLAFLIILVTARGPRTSRFPGIPSILDAILRDATVYFLLIFASQLVLLFFLYFAPVCDPHYIRGWLILLYSCVFRRKFGSCPGCRFFPHLKQERPLSDINTNLGFPDRM